MDIFPFYNVEDLSSVFCNYEQISYDRFSKIKFKTFNSNHNPHNANQSDLLDECLVSGLHDELSDSQYFDGESFRSFDVQKKFSILSCNINSFPKNFDMFNSNYLCDSKFKPNLLAFCETRLDPGIEPLYSIPSYKLIFNSRNTRGGGLLLAIQNEVKFERVDEVCFMLDFIESLFVKISIEGKSYVIGVIYRPPKSNFISFLEKYKDILEFLQGKNAVVCGDLNVDLAKYDVNSNVKSFVDTSIENSFLPLINRPTRVTDHSATIIDHFWTNDLSVDIKSGILMNDCSDHFAPFIWIPSLMVHNVSNQNQISYRKWKNLDCDEFRDRLSSESINFVSQIGRDPDANMINLTRIITDLIDEFAPLKHFKPRQKNDKPWLTSDLKLLIKEKNKIHKKYLLKPLKFGSQYRNIRNRVNNCIKTKKKQYYQNLLLDCFNNSKKTWNVLNELLGRKKENDNYALEINGEKVENKQHVANEFNTYFANITSEIVSTLPVSNFSFDHFLRGNFVSTFFLNTTTPETIKIFIDKLNSTSGGFYEIPAHFFKSFSDVLAEPISKSINCCIESGCFPDSLKIAQIVPLHKSKNKFQLSNYRPISLLPIIGKLFESHIYNDLLAFIEANGILCPQQCGFRKNSSTNIAVTKLLDKIVSGMEERKFGLGVFLDLQKAFDMVDHQILLKKLHFYGIRGIPLQIFSSFLSNRKQCVKINRALSDFSLLNRGVPQGSILSATLFLIFINDIVNCSSKLHFNLFADDTCVYLNDNSLPNLYVYMNEELSRVEEYLSANKLSLNVSKTIYILFKGRRTAQNLPNLCIYGNEIERRDNTKFLGIFIDQDLSWKTHANFVIGKLSRIIGVLGKINDHLTLTTLKTLYYSFFQSSIQYGISFWFHVSSDLRNKIFRLQKKTIRIITRSSFYSNTQSLFYQTKILKLEDLYKLESCKFIHQEICFLNNFSLTQNFMVHNYPTRSHSNLRPRYYRTRTGSNFVLSKGVLLYNNLDENTKTIDSIGGFKCKVKLELLYGYESTTN